MLRIFLTTSVVGSGRGNLWITLALAVVAFPTRHTSPKIVISEAAFTHWGLWMDRHGRHRVSRYQGSLDGQTRQTQSEQISGVSGWTDTVDTE